MDNFLAKAKAAGAKASRAAQRAKLNAEIEYQKLNMTQTQKEFGMEVWESVKAKDNSKIQSIFKTHSYFTRESLIQGKQAQINALKAIDLEQNPPLPFKAL
jgi:YbbR domain-containing protein